MSSSKDGRLQRQNSQYKQNLRDFESSHAVRQQSHQHPHNPQHHRGSRVLPDRERDANGHKYAMDSSKLTRTSTFHNTYHDHGSASLSRKSSYYNNQSNDPSAKLSRKSSMHTHGNNNNRNKQLSEMEKKERKRRQNTESARRTRERKRAEMERLEKVYDANELRIKELEIMADELSRELRRHNTISDPRKDSYAFDNKEERPKWFGAPF